MEQVALLERVRYETKRALPCALQKVECALHSLPVTQVKERVGYGLAVASLQNVLRRKYETLHFEQILVFFN
jgi:hypothetical protein